MSSGIPPAVWAQEGEQAIATALDILKKRDDT